MNESKDLTVRKYKQSGFTLIEMLIVIIILGILAMVIIPQITVSTEDAKVSTLKTNLTGVRGTIEVYYAQHNMIYPGVKTDGTNAAGSALAFVNQLTQFTDIEGVVSGTKTATHIYGPYIKGGALPVNPFVTDAAKSNQVSVAATADVTADRAVLAGGNGWAYWPTVGIFYANDGLSTNGVAHLTY
jgi:prepilin-type N-terminal cleavage/methylation domain-containing protein